MSAIIFFLIVTALSVIAAQRIAVVRGRSARTWMMAAALLGPLPLIGLAVLPGRI